MLEDAGLSGPWSVCHFGLMRRFAPALVGLGLGLAFGTAWWLLWGCRTCDPGGAAWPKIGFVAVMGLVLGEVLGRDHVTPPPS